MTADITYAALASLSLGALVSRPWIKWPVATAGLAFLAWLGIQGLVAAAKHLRADPLLASAAGPTPRRSYATGLLMTLLNPFTLVFWFVAVPSAGAITQDPRHELPMICVGVFIGTIGWVIFFAGLLAWIGRYRQPWWLALADALGGAMLLGLVGLMAWRLKES